MAKRKEKEYDQEQIRELDQIILALATVYGPIDIYELIDKIRFYFPKQYKYLNKKELHDMITIMADDGTFYLDKAEFVSMFSEEEIDELLSIREIRAMFDADFEKEFEDPDEILNYADLFNMRGCNELDALRDFFDLLEFKDEKNREEAFREAVIVIYKMFDNDVYLDELSRRVKGRLDRDKLERIMVDLAGVLPRGFMHGYSLKEMGNRMNDPKLLESFDMDRLEAPKDWKKYGAYSYRECMVKAKKLRETDIFKRFCSDNLIELFINGKEIFIQLLGYYKGDRDIIIYGDRDQMERNYHYMCDEDRAYPDVTSRLDLSEVIMDEPKGFATPEIRFELASKNFLLTPMIVDLDPVKGPQLAGRKSLSLIGAVLDQLLEIYGILKNRIGERCEEGDSFKIIQFYLNDDSVDVGEYTYLELGDVRLPFEVDKVGDVSISAKKGIDLGIGIYAFPIQNEKRPSYVTILYDEENDLIIGAEVVRHEEMHGITSRVIRQLEEKGLRPDTLIFSNEFSEEALEELYEIYDLEYSFEVGDERLDEIYKDMAANLRDPDPVDVLH